MRFTRYIGDRRVKTVTPKADGRIVVILDAGHGVRGKVRIFPDGAAYEQAVRKVPAEAPPGPGDSR